MQVEITDANGNQLVGTATLGVRVVLPDVGPVEPTPTPDPPVIEPKPTPDPPVVEPEPTPPPTWEQFRSNKFGPWPSAPAPGVFRWEADALRWLGACRVMLSATSGQRDEKTQLDFIDCKGDANNFRTLSSMHVRSSFEFWRAKGMTVGGFIEDPNTWPTHNFTDATCEQIDIGGRPATDYTQMQALTLPDGSFLYGTRNTYRGSTEYETGTRPWVFRRLPDGTTQSLGLVGFNPSFYGGGFALVGDDVLLIRGGYLSQPQNGCSCGPAALRVKLATLLAWLDGSAKYDPAAVTVVERHAFSPDPALAEHHHHRPPDYTTEFGWTPPPTETTGYWTVARVDGNPAVMDRGLLWFINQGDRMYYTPASVGRRTMVENQLARALVIDPHDYDRVAAGELEPWQVRGKWYGAANVLPPSIVPICASYDKATRTLFVASNVPGSSFLQAIHAFEVL